MEGVGVETGDLGDDEEDHPPAERPVPVSIPRMGALITSRQHVVLDQRVEDPVGPEALAQEALAAVVGDDPLEEDEERGRGAMRHLTTSLFMKGGMLILKTPPVRHQIEEQIRCTLPNTAVFGHRAFDLPVRPYCQIGAMSC